LTTFFYASNICIQTYTYHLFNIRKLIGIRDSIKISMKSGVAGVHYSKLAMDETEDEVLGLELGLGGFGGIRNGTEELDNDELNRLI